MADGVGHEDHGRKVCRLAMVRRNHVLVNIPGFCALLLLDGRFVMKASGRELLELFNDDDIWSAQDDWYYESNDSEFRHEDLDPAIRYDVTTLDVWIRWQGSGTRPDNHIFSYKGDGPWDGCSLDLALRRWRAIRRFATLSVTVPIEEREAAVELLRSKKWRVS
jgi:hypothetical protein